MSDIVEGMRACLRDAPHLMGYDRHYIEAGANEIERMRKLLDACRESMRVSQRFHPLPLGTDWSHMIEAIDNEIGAKQPTENSQ